MTTEIDRLIEPLREAVADRREWDGGQSEVCIPFDDASRLLDQLELLKPMLAERERSERGHFSIGDEVAVIPGCADWASDWQGERFWIAAVNAVPGGGFDYWISDAWPLPPKPALTDGFYMDVEGKPNTLSLVARATQTGEQQ